MSTRFRRSVHGSKRSSLHCIAALKSGSKNAVSRKLHNSGREAIISRPSTQAMKAAVALIIILSVCLCEAFLPGASSKWVRNAPSAKITPLFLTTADFKNGMTIELEGVPVRLQEFLHVKPGKGAAFVRTKIKNLTNGSVQERTFRAGESIVGADVTKTEMQYTYTNAGKLYFMHMETFEEHSVDTKMVPNVDLLVEGLSCSIIMWNDKVIEVVLPQQVVYTVVEAPPSTKSAQGSQKVALLDCGARINIPMFVETGERILVSTETRKYMNRVDGKSF